MELIPIFTRGTLYGNQCIATPVEALEAIIDHAATVTSGSAYEIAHLVVRMVMQQAIAEAKDVREQQLAEINADITRKYTSEAEREIGSRLYYSMKALTESVPDRTSRLAREDRELAEFGSARDNAERLAHGEAEPETQAEDGASPLAA